MIPRSTPEFLVPGRPTTSVGSKGRYLQKAMPRNGSLVVGSGGYLYRRAPLPTCRTPDRAPERRPLRHDSVSTDTSTSQLSFLDPCLDYRTCREAVPSLSAVPSRGEAQPKNQRRCATSTASARREFGQGSNESCEPLVHIHRRVFPQREDPPLNTASKLVHLPKVPPSL